MLEFIYEGLTAFIKAFSEGEYVTGVLLLAVTLVVLAVAFAALYGIFWLLFNRSTYSEEKTVKAKVVKLSFIPEHGGTHVVPVFTGNGVGTAITSDYEDEKDIVVLKTDDIGRIEIDSAELLENVEKGETVRLTYQEKYTHWVWNASQKSFDEYVPVKVKTKDGTEINV